MVDIRPSLGEILNGYQRISYRPDTAIAEFVDNSTASYFENKAILSLLGENLTIEIVHDPGQRIIEIRDNAWGMDEVTFANALTIAKRPSKTNGRNEFGMGLKTAASWFGKKWQVITKTLDCDEEYTAIVDIEDLMQTKSNEISISSRKADKDSHYTIVRIMNLNRKVQGRTIDKLKSELASIYRKDLNSGEITITVNGEKLNYELPEIYTETIDGIPKTWKKEIDDVLKFDGKEYRFNGFVALRKVGSYKETGFALLRRGRVIIGGSDKNFKPSEIFGSNNSFQSLRIFGEINLDDWPVTQAKDAFDWDLDGLREAFVEKLHTLVIDYIDKAKNARKREVNNEGKVNITEVKEIADATYVDLCSIEEIDTSKENDIQVSSTQDTDNNEIISYTTNITILGTTYNVKVEFVADVDRELVIVSETEMGTLEVSFNTAHPYFSEIKDKEGFTKVFQKYLIIHVLAEKYLEKISTNKGMVYPWEVRETISMMLEEIKNNNTPNN